LGNYFQIPKVPRFPFPKKIFLGLVTYLFKALVFKVEGLKLFGPPKVLIPSGEFPITSYSLPNGRKELSLFEPLPTPFLTRAFGLPFFALSPIFWGGELSFGLGSPGFGSTPGFNSLSFPLQEGAPFLEGVPFFPREGFFSSRRGLGLYFWAGSRNSFKGVGGGKISCFKRAPSFLGGILFVLYFSGWRPWCTLDPPCWGKGPKYLGPSHQRGLRRCT